MQKMWLDNTAPEKRKVTHSEKHKLQGVNDNTFSLSGLHKYTVPINQTANENCVSLTE